VALILGDMGWFFQTYPEYQNVNPYHIVLMMIPFWWTVIVCWFLAIKPILKVIEERERRTIGARDEAADYEAKFNDRLKAYEERIAEARVRSTEERKKVRDQASREEESILAAARAEAQKRVDDVRTAIEAERVKARTELMAQAEKLAQELAEKALGREIGGGSTPARGGARSEVRS
jgi:F-type H+-transporting ATPase subunit b